MQPVPRSTGGRRVIVSLFGQADSAAAVRDICGGLFMLWGLAFTLWMLVDCLNNESQSIKKIIWALTILVLVPFGALIYCCFRRPQRRRELGR